MMDMIRLVARVRYVHAPLLVFVSLRSSTMNSWVSSHEHKRANLSVEKDAKKRVNHRVLEVSGPLAADWSLLRNPVI